MLHRAVSRDDRHLSDNPNAEGEDNIPLAVALLQQARFPTPVIHHFPIARTTSTMWAVQTIWQMIRKSSVQGTDFHSGLSAATRHPPLVHHFYLSGGP